MATHSLESEFTDWMFRYLGNMYLEEKLDKEHKHQKIFGDAQKESWDGLVSCYKRIKADKGTYEKSPFYKMLEGVFEKENNDIESARKLLESKGFKVTK